MGIHFDIAGQVLTVEADPDYIYGPMWKFACDDERETQILITFKENAWDGEYPDNTMVKADLIRIYETENSYIIRFVEPMWIECYICEKNISKSTVYLTERGRKKQEMGYLDRAELMYTIRDSFLFHAQKSGCIAVHSASFIYKDKAWLFSASSGTGKSTHVAMWHKKNYDIKDFNGDLAICYVENGIAMASSVPWNGTSGLYCNKKVPLGGVIYLVRDNVNYVNKIESSEAMLRMSARCLTPNWSGELMSRNVDTAVVIAPLILNGVLHCSMSTEAAEVSKKFIDENMY